MEYLLSHLQDLLFFKIAFIFTSCVSVIIVYNIETMIYKEEKTMAGKDTNKLCDFLKAAGTYYLATADGDQPRVRPFGTAHLFEDRIYILTAKAKDVSKQITGNPRFEISAMDNTGRWIRVSGVLKEDNRLEVHQSILDAYPDLKNMYTAGGDNTNTLYLDEVKAVIYSFTAAPETLDV